MAKNLPDEIARLMATIATAEDCPTQAELDRKRSEEVERERQARWHERFLERAPLRGTERAWKPQITFAVRVVRKWLKNGDGKHLMLRGGMGCGKSTAAACAVKFWTEYPAERGTCAWLKPDQLTSAVLHGYDPTSPSLARNIVLDDVGRETKGGFEEAWCAMVEMRGHTLLMTTNLLRDQLRDRYDPRILDRLRDTTIVVDVPGESMRQGADF